MAFKKERARTRAPSDADEEEALAAVVEAIRVQNSAETAALAAISTWVQIRSKQAAGRCLVEAVAFNFGETRLRGVIDAALPHIGEALSDLPPDKPFFDLDRDDVIEALTRACVVIREYDLRAKERGDFPLDDPIPF